MFEKLKNFGNVRKMFFFFLFQVNVVSCSGCGSLLEDMNESYNGKCSNCGKLFHGRGLDWYCPLGNSKFCGQPEVYVLCGKCYGSSLDTIEVSCLCWFFS